MPLYEYYCSDCKSKFELLVSHKHADDIGYRVDHQLPRVAPVKEGAGYQPAERYRADSDECGTRSGHARRRLRHEAEPMFPALGCGHGVLSSTFIAAAFIPTSNDIRQFSGRGLRIQAAQSAPPPPRLSPQNVRAR